MAQTTYNFNITANGVSSATILDARVLKGTSNVTLNFTFSSAAYDVVKLKVNQQGKPNQLFEGSRIPSTVHYVLQPSSSEYIILDKTIVTVYYSNFEAAEFTIPIYIAQPSLYGDFEGMQVVGAQLLDTADAGDTFIVMQTKSNNIHHMVLYANQILPPVSAEPPPVGIVAAVSAAWNADPAAILTQANTYIQVVQ
jgi:hypothetical protein